MLFALWFLTKNFSNFELCCLYNVNAFFSHWEGGKMVAELCNHGFLTVEDLYVVDQWVAGTSRNP